MRCPCKAVVATRQYHNAPSVHLTETTDGVFEFSLVPDLLGLFVGVPKGGSVVQRTNQPVDAWSHDVLVFVLLEHVHA